MNRFIKLFWLFSLVGFLAALLMTYAALNDKVSVGMGSNLVPALFVSRNTFFYIMVTIVVLSNAALLTLAKVLAFLPSKRQDRSSSVTKSISFRSNLINWLGSFSVILNLFYSIGVVFVGFYNNPTTASTYNYRFWAYAAIIMILLWMVGLVYIIFRRRRV